MIAWLWWGMFGFFALVLVGVISLWLYAMQRSPDAENASQKSRLPNRWILGGGIILPLASVTVLLAVGIPAGQRVLTLPSTTEALRIEVKAQRWWWEFHYPQAGITTANQLYLPASVPIEIHGTSEDVIHSFWVPSLGGKIDLIPGRVNSIRLQADQPGIMRGQCAEFCGSGHAHMIFRVHVLSQADFDNWQQRRQQAVTVPAEHQPAAEAFRQHCGDCHTITGISNGSGAPDLSNIGARRLLGSGRRRGEDIGIAEWLQTHPTSVQGTDTPPHQQLAPEHHDAIAAWLETLVQ